MRSMSLIAYIACLIGFVSFPSACLPKAANAPVKSKPIIRYDANGIPNFMKGGNLSAPLDGDPAFQNLKRKNLYADIALYFLDSRRALFQLTSAHDEFEVSEITSDSLKQKHIKLQQVFGDLPVWGKQVTIHLDRDNRVYFFQGHYQPIATHLNTMAAITRQAARQLALQTRTPAAQWRVQYVTACIWAPSDKFQRLAYQVTLVKNGVYREQCLVDAVDQSLLHCLSATPDQSPPMLRRRKSR